MKVGRVRVGDVLKLERRAVEVKIDEEYDEIGVRSFGRGIFHKERASGASLGNKRVFRIEPGDLVISNVFAWEGAVALASKADAGRIGSHRFMTFVPSDGRVDISWATWLFRSELGLELIGLASPGSAGRNRTLAIDRFEALEIPLPPIEEQRRLADRLGRLADEASVAAGLQSRAVLMEQALVDSTISSTLEVDGWPMKMLGKVAEINPAPQRVTPETEVTFVPMAMVDGVTGSVGDAELRCAGEIGPGYKQFTRDDVLFARITPCMQNGKAAIYSGATAVGYGSTEFHVIRAGPEVSSEWIHRVVRSRRFRRSAAEHFTGTAGQQRVPAGFVEGALIPVPPLDQQKRAIERIDRLSGIGLEVRAARVRSKDLLASLLPSALNEAFAGLS